MRKTILWLTLSSMAVVAAIASDNPTTLVRQPEVDAAAAQRLGVDLSVLKRYELLDFHYSGGRLRNEPIQCGIIRPLSEAKGQSYPLLVWLHGIGREEIDQHVQRGHLRWIEQTVFSQAQSSSDRPCYLLAMQIPKDSREWFRTPGDPQPEDGADQGDEPLTILRELIRQVARSYAVDPDRIYLVGISAGGTACFEMAMRYPNLFAGVVPLASAGGDVSRAAKLAHTPIWAFHAEGDRPEPARAMVSAITAAGGSACLTETPGKNHFCWVPAFLKYPVLNWLFAQRRGMAGPFPGAAPLPWISLSVVAAAVLIVYIGWRSEKKRRRRSGSADS